MAIQFAIVAGLMLPLPATGFSTDNGAPLYEQVAEWLRDGIRRGVLAHGAKLPSSRELAEYTNLNRSTITAAFALLESQGLLHSRLGSGSYVQISRFNRKGLWAKVGVGEDVDGQGKKDLISFATSRPSQDLFPVDSFQECAEEVLDSPALPEILQLGSPQGFLPLRQHLLEMGTQAGTIGEDDDVLITNGCQQAMDLLHRFAMLELAEGGHLGIGIEDPVYPGVRNAFSSGTATLLPMPVEREGVSPDVIGNLIATRQIRMLVLTPDFQNPTGWTMGAAQRKAIGKLISDSDALLVENSIYTGLRYGGAPIASIRRSGKARGTKGGTIVQIGSFSKLAFPGLRVGWVFGPKQLIQRLVEIRHWCDLHTDQLSQAILLQFSLSGRLTEHQAEANKNGRKRLAAVLEACAKHLPRGSSFTRPLGGMNLWVDLPELLDAEELLPHARRMGVNYLPGRVFGDGSAHRNSLRLSFAGLTPVDIDFGLARLAAAASQRLQDMQPNRQMPEETALV